MSERSLAHSEWRASGLSFELDGTCVVVLAANSREEPVRFFHTIFESALSRWFLELKKIRV